MKTTYYTCEDGKVLIPAKKLITIGNLSIANPTAEQYAQVGAYPLSTDQDVPITPEGKVAVLDGYELQDGYWVRKYRYDDAPLPTLSDFDEAMEAHLKAERMARGYTTREPDAYLTSTVPRWKRDAEDWVAHRDAVMGYALELINAVAAGEREPPTLEEFKNAIPRIKWTYTGQEDA